MTTNSSGLQLYEPETTSKLVTKTEAGSHKFEITGYSYNKGIGIGKFVTSGTFMVGGYAWVIRFYPDGLNQESKDHLSFFLKLESVAKEVKAQFKFTLLNRFGGPCASTSQFGYIRTFASNSTPEWGIGKFIERFKFEASDYLKNDSFTIMCTVTVVKESCLELMNAEPVIVPASNLDKHLCYLLETGEGADVTFDVSGELFNAHKWLLAARSNVFRAQFFGLMSEKGRKSIKLDDIKPEVFKVFLHFIYSDSLPQFEEEDDTLMYQHLLVAADQYEIERLKIICENKLSQYIEVNNFATTLTLAEQHNCSHLKTSCFKFVSSTKVLALVTKSDGFEHMTRSCPSVLTELIENMSNDK